MRDIQGIEGAAAVCGGLTDFYNMLQTGQVDCAMEEAAGGTIIELLD